MNILFTFPGQGSQRPGMLQQLPGGDELLDEASTALGEDVRQLDRASALQQTRAVQLCLLIAGVAHARSLRQQSVQPDFCCGLSIGAFAAAVIAGALSFADALRLVALRGTLMERAFPQGYGMTAIIGLDEARLQPLLGDACWLANINAPQQLVIAGSDVAMAEVAARARAAGAQKVHRLAVNAPSHCPLLGTQAEQLAEAFQSVSLARPQAAYLSGSMARVLWQPQQIAADLAQNMARPVRWYDAMVAATEREVGLAVEMPPGAVLTGLTRPVLNGGEAVALEQGSVALIKRLAERAVQRR